MALGTFRMARINKQLQREISLLLESRIKKDAVKDAIITGVECSRDLETARVFFTALDAARRTSLLEELRSVRGALRTLLGQSLKLRHIPALEFVADESSDYGKHIDGILDRLGLNTCVPESSTLEDGADEGDAEDEETDGTDA